jgi:hypothetical protein
VTKIYKATKKDRERMGTMKQRVRERRIKRKGNKEVGERVTKKAGRRMYEV